MSPEVARSPPEDWLYSKGSIKLAKHAHAPVTKPDETATSARAHQTDRRHVGGLATSDVCSAGGSVLLPRLSANVAAHAASSAVDRGMLERAEAGGPRNV